MKSEALFLTSDPFSDDTYAEFYGDKYISKIKELENVIRNHNVNTKFRVFNFEAGLGKSRATLRIIDDCLSEWGNSMSFLIVRRFKSDIEDTVEYLKKHNNVFETKVLGITSDNWGDWYQKLNELENIKVLIISHQRYIKLCLDDKVKQHFSNNRDVLIIDEKINFPMYSFSKKTYDEVRSLLHISIQPEFDKVCKKLLRELQKQENKHNRNKVMRIELKIHPATLANFQKLMDVNIANEKELSKKNTFIHFMEGLTQWYSTKCVYNGGNITTFDPRHKLWGLKNNIILDATAEIDKVYRLGDFQLIGEERIVDHSQSKFTIIDFNSSKSNINYNISEFIPEICEKIIAHHNTRANNKTLIICHKGNSKAIEEQLHKADNLKVGVGDAYRGESYAINWFGNLIGKNEYSDFTQCWIIGTPNIPYEQYLVQYMMYKQSDLGRKSTEIKGGRFKNNEFKAVQLGNISSEIYQCIKRIQRNELPKGEFFIVNNDNEIVEMVLSQIKGSNDVSVINMDFQQRNKDHKEDNVDKFIEFIKKQPIGKYPKKEICCALNITNISRILIDARVQSMLSVTGNELGLGIINIHNKYIEKLVNPELEDIEELMRL